MNSHLPSDLWQKNRGVIRTQTGQWLAGRDARFRDHSLLNDLLFSLTQMQLKVYGVTGRLISAELSQWMEKASFMTAYPDSRLWCNAVARLGASPQSSPVAAATAAFLAADSNAYGSCATHNSAHAIQAGLAQIQKGIPLADVVRTFRKKGSGPRIPGFARPVLLTDERIAPMQILTRELGLTTGAHMAFAETLSEYLQEKKRGGMNAAGYIAAFLLDQGFSPQQIYVLSIGSVECGALPCYQEQVQQQENSFLPLQCNDIEYRGPDRRSLTHQRTVTAREPSQDE